MRLAPWSSCRMDGLGAREHTLSKEGTGAIGFDGDHDVRVSTSRAPITSSKGGSAIAAEQELALAA